MVRIVENLAQISDHYDAVFCDLWGCLHNGVTAFPEAVEALRTYRAKGGKVVLLTNAPRPRASVAKQLVGLNVPEDCSDVIATSGDLVPGISSESSESPAGASAGLVT